MAQSILAVRIFGDWRRAITFTAGEGRDTYGVMLGRLPSGGKSVSFIVRRNRLNSEHSLRKMAGRAERELAPDLDLVVNPHGFASARVAFRGTRVDPFVQAIQDAYEQNQRIRKPGWNVMGLVRSSMRSSPELERAIQKAYNEFKPAALRVLG